jgi:Lon protease-like protein
VGQQRFRLEGLDRVSEPYLLGRVSLLDEPTGPEEELRARAEQVGQRFLDYLELLQPAGDPDGPEIEIEFEIEVADADADETSAAGAPGSAAEDGDGDGAPDPASGDASPAQRRELLMAAARRLIGTDDPTALSYVLTALIQVDLSARQELLEAPDTVERLARLDGLLGRESWFLKQGLRPIIIDAGQARSHRG